ncbi:MAG: arginyl-tRNA synthetase [Cellvibrionaceae bacterium]|jgi:arginyl-tRNA synthetase
MTSSSIRDLLSDRFSAAMQAAGIPTECQPHISPSKNTGSGDYQANGAMGAAKAMKQKPRDIAQLIIGQLDLDDIAEKTEIAGPGFINIYLKLEWLAKQLYKLRQEPQRAIKTNSPQTVVIDYSSPNLAKEMHVGHLRSSIIGDALARILEQQGHHVIRQNHVGDWGTQFGMLLVELEEQLNEGESANLALKDLEGFYQRSKQHFDASEDFANKAREYVVKLQSGDKNMLSLWHSFKATSLEHSQAIYEKLNVTLKPCDVRGESAYNDDLAILVEELKKQDLAVYSQGATVVFLDEIKNKDGEATPVIIQKRGGGYLYSTSDLAALRYRAKTLNADRILYFIDTRQSLHMQQVFTLARKANFVNNELSLEHHAFGTMMGKDGKPFKTRSGGTVKLSDLLDEAIERAEKLVRGKNTDLSESEYQEIGRKVGIGAVKYADLSKTRTNDYIFNWDTMLSFEGNTAPYLQYAYTRIQSIFRKAAISPEQIAGNIIIEHDDEKALAIKCLQFTDVIDQVSKEAFPHLLCTYLYELASLYMRFYESCPILKSGVSDADKQSRLQLSDVTAGVLKVGLDLLGIEVMEKM